MAIKLEHPHGGKLAAPAGGVQYTQDVLIIADTEAEIQALGGVGSVVQETDTMMAVRLKAGSTAVTAVDGAAVVYLLLPGGWQKAGG